MTDHENLVPAIPDLGRYRDFLRGCIENISQKYQARFDASDIVQETLADAQQHLESYRGRSDAEFTSWLRKILARNLLDAVRRVRSRKRDIAQERRLQRTHAGSGQKTSISMQAEQTSPSGRAIRNEEQLQMQTSLAALPEAQRLAITLHHLQGMTLAQVARQMNRSTSAVAGLLHRGLSALQRSVNQES
ncbi:MAG: sigma-70 family RNA polymerase sigma factor [Pirellulales bacterium]